MSPCLHARDGVTSLAGWLALGALGHARTVAPKEWLMWAKVVCQKQRILVTTCVTANILNVTCVSNNSGWSLRKASGYRIKIPPKCQSVSWGAHLLCQYFARVGKCDGHVKMRWA